MSNTKTMTMTMPKAVIANVQRTMISDAESRLEALIEKLKDTDLPFSEDELRSLVVPNEETFSGLFKAGKISKKAKKDPNAPKKAASPYIQWLKDNRQNILDEHFPVNSEGEHCFPEDHENAGEPLKGRQKVSAVGKKAGELWGNVSDEVKAPYQEAFKAAREVYFANKTDYQPKAPKIDYSAEDAHEAPDGWCGPFKGKTLKMFANGRAFGKGRFATFEEAVTAAEALDKQCGGITRGSYGYSLRKTTDLYSDEKTDPNEISWIFGTAIVVEPKAKAKAPAKAPAKAKAQTSAKAKAPAKAKAKSEKKTVGKTKTSKPSKNAVVKTMTMNPGFMDVETETFGPPEDVVEEVVEETDDEDDDDGEVACYDEDLNEQEGDDLPNEQTTYLINQKTNEVYNMDQEPIGNLVNGDLVLDEE